MNITRRFIERDQLTDVVRATFGSSYRLNTVTRLRGGTKKGVYRLLFDDESTAILYSWDTAENYWSAPYHDVAEDQADPFSGDSGVDLFEASHTCFKAIGVRTPLVYLLDRRKKHFPADIAVVEDVRGGTLEARLQHNPRDAEQILVRLSHALQVMQRQRRQRMGKIALIGAEDIKQDQSCTQMVLKRALQDLAEATSRVERVAQVREQLAEKLQELAENVQPRDEYSLIHGELGPDHVLVDEQGDPAIIDIEGAMFCDVEWEHVFLQLRFGEHYQWLRADDLDEQRLRFYALAMHLSLVTGPLELLDGDFPERAAMLGIVEFNIQKTLAFL